MQIVSQTPEKTDVEFAAEDLSVVLLYYLESEAAAHGIDAQEVDEADQSRSRLGRLVDPGDRRLLERLRDIPVADGVDIAEVLREDAYRNRLLDVASERLRVGPDAPALRIAPRKRTPLRSGIGFGLVFGAETTLFQDTVLAFQSDAEASRLPGETAVRVLGVHVDWLDDAMRTRRALIVDASRQVLEVCFRHPQRLDTVEILHLARDRERDVHRRISEVCERVGVAQINPYGVAVGRADDKMQAFRAWQRPCGGRARRIETPGARLVPLGKGRREVVAALLALLGERGEAELVVQPCHGTEGRLVEAGRVAADDPALLRGDHVLVRHALDEILPYDDLLIRESRGNIRLDVEGEPRRLAFRLNVACDGCSFVAESGFAQAACDGTAFVASRGRGGEVVDLGEALKALCCEDRTGWRRIALTDSDVAEMCKAATTAAAALNAGLPEEARLKHMGIDLVLETDNGVLTPVILEANARPAGLSRSHEIGLGARLRPKVTSALFRYMKQR